MDYDRQRREKLLRGGKAEPLRIFEDLPASTTASASVAPAVMEEDSGVRGRGRHSRGPFGSVPDKENAAQETRGSSLSRSRSQSREKGYPNSTAILKRPELDQGQVQEKGLKKKVVSWKGLSETPTKENLTEGPASPCLSRSIRQLF